MEDKKQTRIAIGALVVSIISFLFTALTTIYMFVKSNELSSRLLEYQLSQERLPRVMALNYELPVEILRIDYLGEKVIDYAQVSEDLQPIRIPIYNVGVGFAQNCRITWDKESVSDACENMKNMLSQHLNVYEYERSEVINGSAKDWADADLIFVKENGIYTAVRYCKYSSLTDKMDRYDYDFTQDELMCENIQVPYMLPVLHQVSSLQITVSDGLSMLLLEMANWGIEKPISLQFDAEYQDLTGLNYCDTIKVTFLLDSQMGEENETSFLVMCEVI